MPQLHCYVPESIAGQIRRKAKAKGMTVSRYIGEILSREVSTQRKGWPPGYFEKVLGSWQGDFARPEQLPIDVRDDLK